MLPRSGRTCERISVARSMTLAMFSSPSVILMLSTTVSIAGKVLSTLPTGSPGSKGTYRFGSNVSGAAMPPAIQSTMHASAVAGGVVSSSAGSKRGAPAIHAAVEARANCFSRSRRASRSFMFIIDAYSSNEGMLLPDKLEFGQHNDRPQRVLDWFGFQLFAQQLPQGRSFRLGRLAAERVDEEPINELFG